VEALKTARAVRKHKWLVAGCLLLAIAAAALLTQLVTPVYSASTQLFVAAKGDSPYEGQLFSQQRVRSYADIVNSPEVMSAVITKLGLSTTPEVLAASVSADVPPETVLITVTVRHTSPQLAQAIANATAAQFSKFVARIERTDRIKPPPVTMNIVKPASLPTTPSSPRTLFNLSVGLLVGLVLGVGGALLSESLRPSPGATTAENAVAPIPFGPRRRSPLGDAEEHRRDGTDDHSRRIRPS
jgi:non-specific protein-tyrosine kinase